MTFTSYALVFNLGGYVITGVTLQLVVSINSSFKHSKFSPMVIRIKFALEILRFPIQTVHTVYVVCNLISLLLAVHHHGRRSLTHQRILLHS